MRLYNAKPASNEVFKQYDVATHIEKSQRSKQTGFTLIELLIAIAILSILVAVATPSYLEFVQRGKVSEALATLGNLSIKMEKNYLDFRQYDDAGDCAVSNPTSDSFTFNCISNGQDYTWTATSNDGDYQYTVDNNFNKGTLTFKGENVAAVNCWMISSTGDCF